MALPPFCVPCPFSSSSRTPYSIVVKPTDGCFLKTYQSGHDLHIGLTSSKGLVYNYDEGGVHVDSNLKWSICLAVNILEILKGCSSMILKHWDERLCEYSNKSKWTYDKYNPTLNNCYDFVLSFLHESFPGCQADFVNKENFCKAYILPRTTKAAQYIDLYRKVVENSFVVSTVN
ncbi:MKRN2 opposite strand protein-like isoform X2 [Dendronephthya gigantea]|nr:MKRN2 opposite strand protein-like isoform X2 [Dendronephthya gigantea]